MAQLSNDCFATGERPMSVDAALALLVERITCIAGTEAVALADADHRILAEPVTAGLDLPPFDNSAVDGYAVRFDDLAPSGDSRLPVAGRLAAGDRAVAGEGRHAVRIFTGAPMPDGFDTVFMQEDVRPDGAGRVLLPAGLACGANRRCAGEDLPRGAQALSAGRRLAPADLALLSALGLTQISVRVPLRVAVFSTGNEVAAPGTPLGPGQLYDANRTMLLAMARRRGCTVTDGGILPDRRAAVATALREAAGRHDLVLTSGGVSTGEEDHVRTALEANGTLTLWRVGIKPGRPIAFGMVGGTPFVGLPGNPAAAFVTFALLVRPLLARLAGERHETPRPMPVRSGFSYRKKEGRREYVRVRIKREVDGSAVAEKHPREGAGIITSLTETDGLVELPDDLTRLQPGDGVGFLPYAVLY